MGAIVRMYVTQRIHNGSNSDVTPTMEKENEKKKERKTENRRQFQSLRTTCVIYFTAIISYTFSSLSSRAEEY